MTPRIAIAAIVRNEACYLLEWLAFHLVQGVQLFRIYDNNSDDGTGALLRSLAAAVPIEYVAWREMYSDLGQREMYRRAAESLAGRTDFVATIDIDEFVGATSPGGLAAALAPFGPDVGAIAMNQRVFGSSGETVFRPDLVTARLVRRGDDTYSEHFWFKTISRPEAVEHYDSVHSVRLRSGRYVMTDGAPLRQDQPHPGVADRVPATDIRFHHYSLKSAEEFRLKQARWRYREDAHPISKNYSTNYFTMREPHTNAVEDRTFAALADRTREVMRRLFACTSGSPDVARQLQTHYGFLNEWPDDADASVRPCQGIAVMRSNALHDPLTRLAIQHGSDKYGAHLYTPTYHRLFAHLREQPIRMLEIGVGGYHTERAGGRSLRMWAEYFSYAEITGLDVHRKILDLPPRVAVVQGSQVDEAVIAALAAQRGPFDIIIDDGSHVVDHTITTFGLLYPHMAPDGIYVIEDAQTSFMPSMGGSSDGRRTVFDVADRVARAMHRLEGYSGADADLPGAELGDITHSVSVYRNMVVFQRGANTYPSNLHLDTAHPRVQRVLRDMERESAINPMPTGTLSHIDMLIWGRKIEAARQLALRTADQFPADASVLAELVRMMEWAGAEEAQVSIAARLAALTPPG